jgi:uncharacterized protein (TIGR03067 family)
MKRFLVLLLALGVLLAAERTRFVVAGDDEKKEDKKKDDKDKKDKDKKDKDKPKDKDADKDKPKDKDKDKGKKPEEKPLTAEQKKELEKLSGTFEVTVFEENGKKRSAEELKKMKVVQKGAEWTFTEGTDQTEGKDTVFPDKSPRQINSLYTRGPDEGQTVLGIYKIEGDTITYCWAKSGKERPTEFATKESSGHTLMTLKRVKPEEKDKDKAKDKDKPEKKDKDKGRTRTRTRRRTRTRTKRRTRTRTRRRTSKLHRIRPGGGAGRLARSAASPCHR